MAATAYSIWSERHLRVDLQLPCVPGSCRGPQLLASARLCRGVWPALGPVGLRVFSIPGADLPLLDRCRMMYVRDVFRKRFDCVYKARADLNMEAIQQMAPFVAGGGAGASFSFSSLMVRSKQSASLQSVMDRLKENLREEQRMASELQYIICRKLLQPLQSARLIRTAFPYHCDSMTLLDVAQSLYADKVQVRGESTWLLGALAGTDLQMTPTLWCRGRSRWSHSLVR